MTPNEQYMLRIQEIGRKFDSNMLTPALRIETKNLHVRDMDRPVSFAIIDLLSRVIDRDDYYQQLMVLNVIQHTQSNIISDDLYQGLTKYKAAPNRNTFFGRFNRLFRKLEESTLSMLYETSTIERDRLYSQQSELLSIPIARGIYSTLKASLTSLYPISTNVSYKSIYLTHLRSNFDRVRIEVHMEKDTRSRTTQN